jgi:hypothetical protein
MKTVKLSNKEILKILKKVTECQHDGNPCSRCGLELQVIEGPGQSLPKNQK